MTTNDRRFIEPYKPTEKSFWKITIALALASFAVFSILYSVHPLLPLFVKKFHVSPTTSSLLLSSSVVSMVIGLLLLGFLSDRYGRVKVMIIGLVGSLVCLLSMTVIDHFIGLLVLRFIQGFFLAGLPAAAIAYISEEIDDASVGQSVSIYIASNALGGMAGRVVVGYLADTFDWKVAFIILSGFCGCMTVLFILLIEKSRHFVHSKRAIIDDLKGMLFHLTNMELIPLFLTGFILQTVFMGLWTYLPFYLVGEPYYLSLKEISFIYFAYGFGVISSPIAGRLSSQYGLVRMLVLGIYIMVFAIFLTLIQATSWIVIGFCLICFGFFIAHSMAAAIVSQTAKHHKGSASSFYLVSYYVGVATGGTATGFLWTQLSWYGVTGLVLLLFPIILFYIRKVKIFNREVPENIKQ
ncbi:MFS transporter [Salirhabdus salicampi]|uniref:MFS transporter n=1 Tax=Salirhabdus salicampi TaxID=476102 RepID=UPI0020C38283|nr:MFS transporter [Salirhabdus salicampi]MCP8615625.1 MFS transporter [Salirhabdus salicampi]